MTKDRSKRLIFCFDGTWNRLSANSPTNVVLVSQMVKPMARDGTPQVVYYDEGIGTGRSWPVQMVQGALGHGMLKILREAYRFLIFNYEPGDEIFAFGFSRGAYTARSFIGFVRHAGILDAVSATQIEEAIRIYKEAPAGETGMESLEGLQFRAQHCTGICVSEDERAYRAQIDPEFDPASSPLLDVRYVGVWDTVRALGVPEFVPFSGWINRKYGFHDAILTSKIKAARHAVALDESRLSFRPTLFGRDKIEELNIKAADEAGADFDRWSLPYQEQWFPGVHGAIGGGGARRGLSDAAMQWVLNGARRAGLDIRSESRGVAFNLCPDPFDDIYNDKPGLLKRAQAAFHRLFRVSRQGPIAGLEISLTTFQRWTGMPGDAKPYRPLSLRQAESQLANWDYREPVQFKGTDTMALFEEYQIDRRDTLSHLAKDRLGDPERWRELFDINRDRLDDPSFLPIGLKIRLPKKAGSGPGASFP